MEVRYSVPSTGPRIQLGGAVDHVTNRRYTTVGRDDMARDSRNLNDDTRSASQQLELPPGPLPFLLNDDCTLEWQPLVAPPAGGEEQNKSSWITLSRRLLFILCRPEREIDRFLFGFALMSDAILVCASLPGASLFESALSVLDLLLSIFVFPPRKKVRKVDIFEDGRRR